MKSRGENGGGAATSQPAPATSEVAPATSQPAPATSEVAAATSEAAAVTSEVAPVSSEVAAVTSEAAPVTREPAAVTMKLAAVAAFNPSPVRRDKRQRMAEHDTILASLERLKSVYGPRFEAAGSEQALRDEHARILGKKG